MVLRLTSIIVLAILMLAALPTNIGTADACWCRSGRINEVVEGAEQVFTFEVTEVVVVDELNAVAYGDVVEVFKGAVEARVRVGMSFKKLCFDVALLKDGVVLAAIGSKGKYKAGGVCSGEDADAAVAPLFEATTQPLEPTPPRFIRPESKLGVRVAALDDRLRPTQYGLGWGTVVKFAMCPGGQRVLELVAGGPKKDSVTVEVRNLATLEIESSRTLDRDRREARRLRDFECHDESGGSFSYLNFRGVLLVGQGAVVEVWTEDKTTRVPADRAIAAAVDLELGLVHILVPSLEPRVEQWDIGQEQLIASYDLPHMKAVDLEVEPATGNVTILGGSFDAKAKPHAKGFLARIVDGRFRVNKIAQAVRPVAMEFIDGRLYTVVQIKGEGRRFQTRELDGSLLGDFAIPKARSVEFAVSGETVAIRTGFSEYRAFANRAFKATQRVEQAGPIAAFREDGSEITISVADIPALLTAKGSIVEGGPLPPSRRSVSESSSRFGLVLIALVGAAAAVGFAVVWKRRSSEPDNDGWMA